MAYLLRPQLIRSAVLGVRRIMSDASMFPKCKVALGPEAGTLRLGTLELHKPWWSAPGAAETP